MKETFPKKKKNELNIFFWVSENSGVGYFRQYLPAVTLREKGICNTMINDFRWGEGDHVNMDMKTLMDVMVWADLVVVGRMDQGNFYAQWGGIREFFNIPIIMDTDDNVRFVRPSNPGYQGYHPGSEAIQWNKQAISKVFDAITVTTQDLKDFHEKENPKIYVLPNSVDLKKFDSFEKKKYSELRFGFIGSAAHSEGVKLIKKPVLDILKKYPHTKFVVTHLYKNFFLDVPEELQSRIEYAPWIKLEQWQQGMKELGLDIGLAPLVDNMFNRAKSNLRWLEYSACNTATIASPVKPYLCIQNGVDGILAKQSEEWYTALEKLITNKELRETIAENAYARISKEFDIGKNAHLWYTVYEEVTEKFHSFFGPKKSFIKIKPGKYKLLTS